jgi:hypothetical protein
VALDTESDDALRAYVRSLAKEGHSRLPLSRRAQGFVYAVLAEALEFRLDEPAGREYFGPTREFGAGAVLHDLEHGGPLNQQVNKLLVHATEIAVQSKTRTDEGVMLIDLLVTIQADWCNVWPFCRPRPDTDQ